MITIGNERIRLLAEPEDGMTVCSLAYNGMETIEADEERRKAGSTYGIPILFPTPNRVSGGRYSFGGRDIAGIMHGNLRHSAFSVTAQTPASVDAELPFSALGESFPYEGIFSLKLSVSASSARWDFDIRNEGDEPLSLGLALHPFFLKMDGMRFSSSLEYEMEADDDKIPTGKWHRTDFGSGKDVSSIDTDTVFFSDSSIRSTLSSPAYTLEITGSEEFGHVVVYTAPDRSFICVEPQTCSTDAHNMHSKGFVKEAGLIIVPAHSSHRLWVRMDFS